MASLSGRFLKLAKFPKLTQIVFRTYAEPAAAHGGLKMPLIFGTPNHTYYNNVDVKQIDVPSFSGNFGILPSHVPTIAVIKRGVITVYEHDGKQKKIFVSSGTITVNEDSSVQILAEEACDPKDLDSAACSEGLAAAQRQLASATSEVAKAEAEISVEAYDALVKAAAESSTSGH